MNSLQKSTAILVAAALSKIRALRVPFALLIVVLGSTAGAATVQVRVGVPFDGGYRVFPNIVFIHPGDTVEWIWRTRGHSVTSGSDGIADGRFDSGIQEGQFPFSHTFRSLGVFPYFCKLHWNDSERGAVSVGERTTGRLGNISTRASVQTGDQVTIAGFIVTGTDPKPVLIRGLGPTLGTPPSNVPGSLQDPTLELHNATTRIARNDDWQQAANAGQIPVGLRPTDPRESAILVTLQPGNYTAIMAGKNETGGIGLVEVYDMNGATLSQLSNVSTRGFVGTGDSVMVGGFITRAGRGNTRVVVRALGPTLAASPSNLSGVLADPLLTLKDANGVTIAKNDNWYDDNELSGYEVRARGFAPANSLESAIVTIVPPGNYTALVSGVGGGTGIALVEVYNVP